MNPDGVEPPYMDPSEILTLIESCRSIKEEQKEVIKTEPTVTFPIKKEPQD